MVGLLCVFKNRISLLLLLQIIRLVTKMALYIHREKHGLATFVFHLNVFLTYPWPFVESGAIPSGISCISGAEISSRLHDKRSTKSNIT